MSLNLCHSGAFFPAVILERSDRISRLENTNHTMKQTKTTKNTRIIRNNHRRGFTIVELTVVLAVSAIVFAMVASFSVLVSGQVKRNRLRTDFLSAVSDCKLALQTKCAELDGANKTISVSELQKLADDDLYTCIIAPTADGKYLQCTFTNDKLKDEVSFLLASHCGATFDMTGVTE